MSFINYMAREINCKIVYYGPGLCGKTTNLQYIYERTNPDAKGKMISLATETERTLFFDFLPLSLGEIRGFKTRFHLYTVPGQVFYDASRKLILKGVDGVIFVADSQMERLEANQESVENLRTNLAEQGYSLDKHCRFLMTKTGALSYRIMPAKRLFALGVGHVRRKGMEPGSKADVPAEVTDTNIVELSDLEWQVLGPLKREFAPDEIREDLWRARADEAVGS